MEKSSKSLVARGTPGKLS